MMDFSMEQRDTIVVEYTHEMFNVHSPVSQLLACRFVKLDDQILFFRIDSLDLW